MVGLPSMESRELIMRRLLSKEKVDEGLDYKELATMTEGYSGSDLKVSSMKHECKHMRHPAHPKMKNEDTMLNFDLFF
jgi:ATP-dependent 26S proteasome regulatory subunit